MAYNIVETNDNDKNYVVNNEKNRFLLLLFFPLQTTYTIIERWCTLGNNYVILIYIY